MSDVQGLILAAGRGSRLRELTASRPKALVRLCGKPLIKWQQLALRSAGLHDVFAIGGYRGDMLRASLPVVLNDRWQTTNMVFSMLQYLNEGRADIIVSYSDIVYSKAGVDSLLACSADIAIAYDVNWSMLWSARFTDPLEDAESFRSANGKVEEIGQKVSSLSDVGGQFMGLLKLSARGWATCAEFAERLHPSILDMLDMTGLLSRLIAAGYPVAAVPYNDPWGEVDSESDLTLYEEAPQFSDLRDMLAELARRDI